MHIVALALKAVGINVDKLTLSASSLYGSRKAIRQSIGKTIKNTFLPNTPLVAHFDGKLLPDFDGVNIDRLPIVVSGKNVEKLIAIPKVGGTGINIGTTIVQLLQNWEGVSNWLAGLCFDTTSWCPENSSWKIHRGKFIVGKFIVRENSTWENSSWENSSWGEIHRGKIYRGKFIAGKFIVG
ncbi:hypothetical protein HELRODRAFT_177551 [Helobdella robusta]|uniref:Uncharacterized protein n=1 Tax=Helobdella robusta TaxID=6412 RepID=T1FBV3_HELRO|nr:hypothetical protein HELRODRAFT_177551 [Helobdella robusta]ESN97899.1 hypothetical protein HELRODRAFT_177551 [Helobdella robusta]